MRISDWSSDVCTFDLAAHPRPLDEIVGQNLVPQLDDFAALRKEAMPTDVEAKALMLDRPADPADVNRVLLDHRHAITLLRQRIGGGQPRGAGTDDGDVGAGRAAFRTRDIGPADYSPQTKYIG